MTVTTRPMPRLIGEGASSAEVSAQVDQLKAQTIPDIRRELAERQGALRLAKEHRGSVYAMQRPGAPASADEIAADQDVQTLQRDVDRLEAALEAELALLERLSHALPYAEGEELLAKEAEILARYPQTKLELLEALLAAVNARGAEHALDVQRHSVRVELDKIAEKTGDSRFRRGVFVFDGAYRPQLERIGDALQVLFTELGMSIDDDGRIVPRAKRPASAIATSAPAEAESAVEDPDGDPEDDEGAEIAE
jgi:hypothetical protein